MGSENIFDNLKPLKDELGLGRELLVEVCKQLKINFLEHTMEDDDDSVSIGFWPRQTVPVVLGTTRMRMGLLCLKARLNACHSLETKESRF